MKKRTVEEKKQLLNEFLLYEIDILECMNKYHRDLINSNIDKQFAENIIVEINIIHARNLLEFFYYGNEEKESATASQFLKQDKDWKKLRPPLTDSIKTLQKRVNTEVTHLTYKRIVGKPDHKLWNFEPLYKDLMSVFCIFVENVAEEYFDDRLRLFKERLCK